MYQPVAVVETTIYVGGTGKPLGAHLWEEGLLGKCKLAQYVYESRNETRFVSNQG
jgi:hypothetical protein